MHILVILVILVIFVILAIFVIVLQASEGGVYVARNHVSAGAIAGGVIAGLVVVVLLAATIFYFRAKPEKMDAITRRFRYAKRSTQSAI